MTKPHKWDYHYSGDGSEAFWKRVNSLPELDKREAYALGIALQNLEGQVLRSLANAENEKRYQARMARKKKK